MVQVPAFNQNLVLQERQVVLSEQVAHSPFPLILLQAMHFLLVGSRKVVVSLQLVHSPVFYIQFLHWRLSATAQVVQVPALSQNVGSQLRQVTVGRSSALFWQVSHWGLEPLFI